MRAHLVALMAGIAVASPVTAEPAVPTPTSLADVKLAQITLSVRDLDRAVAFYRDVLGLRLLFTVDGAAFFELPGQRLRLERAAKGGSGTTLYFDDPGLTRADGLRSRGIKFEGPAETVQRTAQGNLEILEFQDPDGNNLALMGLVAAK